MKIKVLKKMPGFNVGSVITLPDNGRGVPKSHYWRKRLRDAKTDGCCEIVIPVEPAKETKAKKKGKI